VGSFREEIMICLTKHNKGAEILLDYGAQKLDAQTTAEIERHAQSCEQCRGLIRAQRAVWQSLDEFTSPETSANFDERLYLRIAQEQQLPAWRRWISRNVDTLTMPAWKPALGGALAAAVLAAGFLAPLHRHEAGNRAHVPYVSGAEENVADKAVRVPSKEAQPDVEQMEQTLEDLDLLQPVSGSASRM
jgi:hypothetical protein